MNEVLLLKDCFFLDAPISGGQLGADSGNLSIMAGGDREAYEACNKIFKSYSKVNMFVKTVYIHIFSYQKPRFKTFVISTNKFMS